MADTNSADQEAANSTETDSAQVDVMENYLQPTLAENFPDIEFDYIPAGQDNPLKTMSASGDLPEIFYTDGGSLDAILGAGDALNVREYAEKDGWLETHYNNPDLYPLDGECLVRNLLKGIRMAER